MILINLILINKKVCTTLAFFRDFFNFLDFSWIFWMFWNSLDFFGLLGFLGFLLDLLYFLDFLSHAEPAPDGFRIYANNQKYDQTKKKYAPRAEMIDNRPPLRYHIARAFYLTRLMELLIFSEMILQRYIYILRRSSFLQVFISYSFKRFKNFLFLHTFWWFSRSGDENFCTQ